MMTSVHVQNEGALLHDFLYVYTHVYIYIYLQIYVYTSIVSIKHDGLILGRPIKLEKALKIIYVYSGVERA